MEREQAPGRVVLWSTMLWGILAHGMMLFNKFSFHDDARLAFHIGATVSSGRWMLEVLKRFFECIFGGSLYSLPLFNGVGTLLLMALASYMLVRMLRLKSRAGCALLAGLMVVFPVVTATLGYMYTAPYYMLGLDMAVAGAWLIDETTCVRRWYFLPAGSFLIACGIGVYQACIPFILTLLLLCVVRRILDDAEGRSFYFFRTGFTMAGGCVLFLAFYLVGNWLGLRLLGVSLSDYESISSFGFSGWAQYWDRVCLAYREFFVPAAGKMRDMYPLASLRWFYRVVLVFGVLLAADRAALLFRACKARCAEFLLLTALFPLAVNFILVMVDAKLVHSLMMGSEVFTFIFFLMLLEHAATDHRNYPAWLPRVGLSTLTAMALLYCYFANICYFKADVLQAQAISYFTRLVSRIESTQGYSPELPVVYLNELHKRDLNLKAFPEFRDVRLVPYLYDDRHQLINNYAWKDFMALWCGYSPVVLENTEKFEALPEVLAMPRYPLEGSVRVVGQAVVVKF